MPLGQVAGQRLLRDLADDIPRLTEMALTLADDELGGNAFSVALSQQPP